MGSAIGIRGSPSLFDSVDPSLSSQLRDLLSHSLFARLILPFMGCFGDCLTSRIFTGLNGLHGLHGLRELRIVAPYPGRLITSVE